jgi:quercetin dioxygenase-like cupin family protein
VANFLGEYFWHKHNVAEFFYVLSGEIEIQLKSKKPIKLKTGEFVEIRKNVWHCPKAKQRAVVLMIEKKTIKTIKYDK